MNGGITFDKLVKNTRQRIQTYKNSDLYGQQTEELTDKNDLFNFASLHTTSLRAFLQGIVEVDSSTESSRDGGKIGCYTAL